MMPRMSSSLRLLLALLCMVTAQGATIAFHLNEKGAYCKSGVYDVDLQLVKFACDTGDNICRPGDNVVVEGYFNAQNYLPVDVTERTRVCKYWGAFCSPVLDYQADSLQNTWHLYSQYGNSTYPNKGYYGFEKRFVWPDNKMTDYPWAGFTFNMVVDIQAEDAGNDYTHLRCHAPFTTVNLNSFLQDGSTGQGFSTFFGSVSMIGLVGLGAFMKRKRRLSPSINLDDEVPSVSCTNFEMMDSSATGGDAAAVRV